MQMRWNNMKHWIPLSLIPLQLILCRFSLTKNLNGIEQKWRRWCRKRWSRSRKQTPQKGKEETRLEFPLPPRKVRKQAVDKKTTTECLPIMFAKKPNNVDNQQTPRVLQERQAQLPTTSMGRTSYDENKNEQGLKKRIITKFILILIQIFYYRLKQRLREQWFSSGVGRTWPFWIYCTYMR